MRENSKIHDICDELLLQMKIISDGNSLTLRVYSNWDRPAKTLMGRRRLGVRQELVDVTQ